MNKRFLLAITLCVSLFWIWQYVGFKAGYFKTPPKKTSTTQTQAQNTDPSQQQAEPQTQVSLTDDPNTDPQASSVETPVFIEPTLVTIENDSLMLVFDNKGGVLKKAVLKNYYQTAKRNNPIQLVPDGLHFPGEVIYANGLSTLNWMFEVSQPTERGVVFTGKQNGIEIKKSFLLDDNFGLSMEVATNSGESFYTVVSEGLQPIKRGEKLQPSLLSFGAINPKYSQVTWDQQGDTKKKDVAKPDAATFQPILKEEKVVNWLGTTDNYFANVFKGEAAGKNVYVKAGASISEPGTKKPIYQDVVALKSDSTFSGMFYMGPLSEDVVEQYPGLENVISFGWAGMLSKGLFVLLRACHNVLGNWGWSIIVLTLFIKLILMPLTLPGIKSSYKMKKLQPKIQKLRQKYKGDDIETKQKMNQEMFALYKKEGVNPFGSCLTGIVQMPIFFAYFSLLRSAFELRQADWMLWVTDLSAKDSTFILVLVMGATMYFSMQAMQMSVDPMQQRMMKFMPVVFTLFFIGMPSGLILYMITSNLYTMFQTYFFRRRYEAHA